MGDPIVWMGGWASGLACWRGTLEAVYPHHEHAFLDAHAVLEEPALLGLATKGLSKGGTLIAWSMGSLILHKALVEKSLSPECRLVSLCPIFDFCREGGPWPKAAVIRMARRLSRERDAVLSEFWNLAKGTSAVTQDLVSAWIGQSRGYAIASLQQGLEFLRDTVVERSALPANDRHFFLSSPQDPLAPTPRGIFPGKEWIAYARGHLPFLDHPELLAPILEGASAGSAPSP
jgi:hypothetical protein